MKFKKLDTRVEKVAKKKAKGKKIEAHKLKTLKQLLGEKKSGYEDKLSSLSDAAKRKSFETKLKVVNAHLKKIEHLLSRD